MNAYNLTFAVLLITAAALGDRFGRRRLFAGGLLLFAAASAGCALAPNVETLIAARAVQGAGAALLMPLGLALLSAGVPAGAPRRGHRHLQRDHRPRRRGRPAGRRCRRRGPVLALDLLAQRADRCRRCRRWRCGRCGRATARAPRSTSPASSSCPAASLGVVWGLVRGNQSGWGSPEVVTSLVGGVVLLGGFVRWQLQTATPMLPPRLFRSRAFTAGNAAIFLTFASLFTGVFFFAQLLQVVLGSRRSRRRAAAAAVDGDLHHRGTGRRRAGRPDRRAVAAVRRPGAARPRASCGWSPSLTRT